ncbi:hypothetical protein PG990_015077 [Apiospora arundinis]|uniref:Rna polymerase ii paf1 protein n=1 Tax=Apiospora arundinis TaxID=335852 RepID=A0ABR2HL24_9PEZI
MASSSRNGERRPVHQDFIARIRFSNALPPPPHPPKLLDIPNTGLASGHYTAPSFAGRLAREQPLNIEADAELGMPLDLVGMPGIFDGDESSIQAPSQVPQPHPHDKPLLRSIAQLGKPKTGDGAVSFLRRTEYIAASGKSHQGGGALRPVNPALNKRVPKRKSPEPDRDSPAYVKRKIDQGFATAEANLKDRSRVRHPSKRNLKLVDAYPLLPDPEAFPDSGAYVTIKFLNNPVSDSSTYDKRLLHGLFQPLDKSEAEEANYQAMLEAHEMDPANNPKPENTMNYAFFLPDTSSNATKFGQRFDPDSPKCDDDSLYPSKNDEGKPVFPFQRVRAYETTQETELNHTTKYDKELLLAFNNEETSLHQKAAYFYPVMQRSTIRPQRMKNIARVQAGLADENEQIIDELHVTVDAPTEQIMDQIESFKTHPYGSTEAEEHQDAAGEEEVVEVEEEADAEGEEED